MNFFPLLTLPAPLPVKLLTTCDFFPLAVLPFVGRARGPLRLIETRLSLPFYLSFHGLVHFVGHLKPDRDEGVFAGRLGSGLSCVFFLSSPKGRWRLVSGVGSLVFFSFSFFLPRPGVGLAVFLMCLFVVADDDGCICFSDLFGEEFPCAGFICLITHGGFIYFMATNGDIFDGDQWPQQPSSPRRERK